MSVQPKPDAQPSSQTNTTGRLWLHHAIRWIASIGSVAVATALVAHLEGYVEPVPNAIFFCAIIFSAWFGGWGPGILAAILSVLAIKYYATPPFHYLGFSPREYPRFILFLGTGLFISWLTSRQKKAEEALRNLSRELDNKVRDRTAELRKTNEDLKAEMAERKRAEELLRTREQELRTIVENTPDWIVRTDRTLKRTYVNPAFVNAVGMPKELLLGSQAGSAVEGGAFQLTEEESAIFGEALRRVFETGQALHLENSWTFKTRRRHFMTHLEPEFDANGEVTSILSVARDITEVKDKEEKLREVQSELARISRVTMLGELTTSIAHEVNQPLTAVLNNANACISLLESGVQDSGELNEALAEIVHDGERASAIIKRIRALVKKAPPKLAPCNLREVVMNVLAMPPPESSPRDIVVRTDLPESLPWVPGDEIQIEQVLLNLVMNGMEAMTHMPTERRKLEISAKLEQRNGKPGVTISVKDSGPGLKAGESNRIFDAFYTTKNHGLGMGLAISRSIIESHGGHLWVESVEGQGAAFSFWLPEQPTGQSQ